MRRRWSPLPNYSDHLFCLYCANFHLSSKIWFTQRPIFISRNFVDISRQQFISKLAHYSTAAHVILCRSKIKKTISNYSQQRHMFICFEWPIMQLSILQCIMSNRPKLCLKKQQLQRRYNKSQVVIVYFFFCIMLFNVGLDINVGYKARLSPKPVIRWRKIIFSHKRLHLFDVIQNWRKY